MFRKILFICVGNVCRSPTAEAVMRRLLDGSGVEIGSAGLQALVGSPIDPIAQEVLLEHGMDGAGHRARQADRRLLGAADLILVMERRQLLDIARDVPQVSGKTFLLGKWCGDREIGDPYRQARPAFEHAYRLIKDCAASWAPHIR
ncbi:MAG: low molecular weight protein-tyrosine-phosphatase [Pseudoxanthomonas sp.]